MHTQGMHMRPGVRTKRRGDDRAIHASNDDDGSDAGRQRDAQRHQRDGSRNTGARERSHAC